MTIEIRQAGEDDREALFRICLLTSRSGTDGSADYSDPHYPGYVWAVPYLELEPAHAFVLADGGKPIGYVVGAPDTLAFEADLEHRWWPELRSRHAASQPRAPSDARVLEYIGAPERTDPALAARYPAHLHINILPGAQGGGWGRRLIKTELESLREAGAPAVHLGVSLTNERALGFYRHLGFAEIERGEGVTMGMRL
ncbi:GNAT family N-acetyltransferase [Aureimonas leprariae]|uniref:GNAT family N-acetyltransferase n=1 Tax=Plantimonas leprariae TaxID=2615207 RepID=A0A7V7TUN8_9HYPH|nr:GNAT family N-acetyltransferase [Aureimonas leprariae]KAB0676418.1 GNAT family N-acetyltransferase [Aureimonas leprariae]